MENDLLSEVVQVEKEIQKNLDLEKVKSWEWLENARKEIEEEFTRTEQQSTALLQRSTEEAKHKAGLKAAEVVQQASLKATRLETTNNEVLSQVLEKHIGRVLPG